MAEKQLAYRAGGKDEFFADDDPLAELARIVGYDKRPSTPVAANQRQEPAFDLEDELLREFERYDAPRGAPASQPAPSVEANRAPDVSPEPDRGEDLPAETTADFEEAYAPQARHEPQAPHVPEPQPAYENEGAYSAPVAANDSTQWNPAEESWDSVVEPATMPVDEELVVEQAVAGAASAPRDLADELEMSIGAPEVQPVAPKTQQWAAATIRLPLANFNAPRRDASTMPAPEPVIDIPTSQPAPVAGFESPMALDYPAEIDRHESVQPEASVVAAPEPVFAEPEEVAVSSFDQPSADLDTEFRAAAAVAEPVASPSSGYQGLDIDDLLADVSRYPVPSREEIAARFDSSLAKPVAPAAPEAAPAAAMPAEVRQPDPAPVAQAAADEGIDGFDDHDFDLDLADIELELAELDFSEPKPVAAAVVASPVVTEPVADWRQPAPAAEPRYDAPQHRYEKPIVSSFATQQDERYEAPSFAAPMAAAAVAAGVSAHEPAPVVDEEQELPFDPNEIGETEDRVESFEGIHVPALPPAEPEEPVSAVPDYDFDIDAEMANLFNAPADATPEPARAAPIAEAAVTQGFAAAAAPVRGVTMQAKAGEGLDEFERALEEDFRRSFRETSNPPENVSQLMFESSHTANDRWRARSMRGLAIAAAAVVVLGGGAYGMYRWVAHSGSPLSFASGEPRVITADKDPIKVVPADPGGKVVPNQDKAVYDRVAGAANQPPKQKELVTSDEQPVDVVQKTLIPENSLPDDSEGSLEAANQSTPVGETEDPRLLPGQGNAAPVNGQDNSAVAPRRVRTMIVKPDGSLVAREEAPPVDDNVTTSTATATPTPAANTQVASASDSDGPSAESAPIRTVKTTQLANTPPALAAATPAADAPLAATTDTAPIPTVRPTRPNSTTPPPAAQVAAKPPVATQPTQVASANPATPPVKAPAAVSTGGYVMQIASLPSEDEAKRSQANMSAKYASVLGGRPMEVRKVDIAGKGTYYRVRVAAGSKDDAAALCTKFRAAGGTCLISK
ncbi:SPOR domain-containing protein [Rhizobium sp. HT1-10]|uniref:SPOR domain-containing protein n=1 Tax=Rhizobium sp. HT1-10 TaxID=3111638 RepID=UPI003C1D1269